MNSNDLGHIETSYTNRIYFFTEFNKYGILDYMGEVFAKRYSRSINRSADERDFYLVPYFVFKIYTTNLDNNFYIDPWSQTYCDAIYS